MGSGTLLILIVVMFALMYFMVMRPQKKQMDKQREMLNRMDEGTRVMLTSGVFGTVRATGENQAVIELAPGVDITVLKQAISKIVRHEDEEFEFADGEPVDDATESTEPDEATGAQSDESAEAQSDEATEADGAGSGEQAAPGEGDDAEHEDGAADEAATARAVTEDAENDQN